MTATATDDRDRDSDSDSFREFVRVRFEPLRAWPCGTCGDWPAAEDAGALARLYLRWDRMADVDGPATIPTVRVLREIVGGLLPAGLTDFAGRMPVGR